MIEVAGTDGIQWYEVPVPDDQTEAEIVDGLQNLDPSYRPL